MPDRTEETRGDDAKLEELVVEYLARRRQETTLDRFLSEVPPEYREACRKRIQEVTGVENVLADLAGDATGVTETPTIPGFRLERELGRGGLGRVYEAWDETLHRSCLDEALGPCPFPDALPAQEGKRESHQAHQYRIKACAGVHGTATVPVVCTFGEGLRYVEHVQGHRRRVRLLSVYDDQFEAQRGDRVNVWCNERWCSGL